MKIRDPNTSLPKCVLIAWCGGGVPERTKGYFTSHTAAVAKVLHGYHVQITARSDSDLEPQSIMKKVSDASGSKYSSAGSDAASSSAPPPLKSKPVFTPTAISSGSTANPLIAARSRRDDNVDEDGWGSDAPPVTRTQLEKVEPAYRPTKVNMAELTKGPSQGPRPAANSGGDDGPSDVVKGGYQPVGKVDIAAIRAAATKKQDDRPTPVKGAYEPVGKVDIAAIRFKAQRPAPETADDAQPPEPKPVAERAAAFSQATQSERITSMPKPKVAHRFGSGSAFAGTKAPVPTGLGLGGPAVPAAAPVGSASRTFADQGGKTPAQIWAEKKAKKHGSDASGSAASPITPTVAPQKSGGAEWKSGYTGKSWAPVQTSGYGRGAAEDASQEATEDDDENAEREEASSAGGVSALRDRFKGTTPIGLGAAGTAPVPKAMDDDARPAPVAPPPSQMQAVGHGRQDMVHQDDNGASEEEDQRESSPIRVAAPVARSAGAPAMPTRATREEVDVSRDEEAAQAMPDTPAPVAQPPSREQAGKRAFIQYDYDKAEDNEIDLVEGEYVTNIDMVDEDWWMGTNAAGESGLFPSNYVELVEDEDNSGLQPPTGTAAVQQPVAEPEPDSRPSAGPSATEAGATTATALFDYEAAEDNGKHVDSGAGTEAAETNAMAILQS